ncbi:MAG: hypothetical protein ABR547_06080, partial [Halanaerobium sp.]
MLKKFSIFFLLLLLLFALSGCDQFYFKDYEASGKVEDSSGTGIQGATINFSDGSSVKSLSDGSWKQTGLKGDIEITPKKSDYTFTPTAHQLSQLDENKDNIIFKADSNGTDSDDGESGGEDGSDDSDEVEETFTASGTITSKSEEAIPEVVLTFDDGSSPVKTGTTGEWEKTGLTGNVTVTPEIEGWQFETANKTVNPDEKIADFTASPKKDYSHYSLSGEIYNNDSLNLTIIIEKDDGTIINRTVTDEGGNWQVNHVWGKVNIKPQTKETVIGYEPEIQTASMEDDNIKFTATAEDQSYTATGSVTDGNGDPVSGVVLSFSDGSDTVKTGSDGNWKKAGLVGEIT